MPSYNIVGCVVIIIVINVIINVTIIASKHVTLPFVQILSKYFRS